MNVWLVVKDGECKVLTVPEHKRDEAVFAECGFTQFDRMTIGGDGASFDNVTNLHQWLVVDAGVLV